jgi:hypothetical protein
LIVNGVPIEIKYCAALAPEHRRQAAIYASLLNVSRAILINVREANAEWVGAAPRRQVTNVAKAAIALREGRKQALGPLREKAIAPPEGLQTGCVVSLDSEYCLDGAIIELSAIAFNIDTGDVLSVFDYRHPAVDETCPSVHQKEWTDVYALTGLVPRRTPQQVTPSANAALLSSFARWRRSLPVQRSLVHWAGSEKLLAETEHCVDLHRSVFHAWLAVNKMPRVGLTTLTDAASQTVPMYPFAAHRAFEDALAAMMVLVATTDFSGRL